VISKSNGSAATAAKRATGVTETFVTLRVEHNKPLPAEFTDILTGRVYTWLMSQGITVDVTAAIEARDGH
jgi:hypothetical protein